MKINNQSGFSLLEILVVMFVMGILSLGLASFMVQQLQSQRQAESKRSSSDVAATALQAAAHQDALMATEATEVQDLGMPAQTPAGFWDPNNQYNP